MKYLILLLFMCVTAQAQSTLLTGLQAYYALENVNDSSGNALTLTNNNTVTFSAGKVNNAANFVTASSQSLTHTDNALYQPGTGNWSVSAWVKFSVSENNDGSFVGYGTPQSGTGGWTLGSISDKILARIGDGTNNTYVWNASTSNDGAWHLMVATFNRVGNMELFVDNVSVGTSSLATITGNIHTSSSAFFIGDDVFGDFLTGSVDEVGIWNKVLTGTEVTALWNGGAGVTYPFGGPASTNRVPQKFFFFP